MNLLALSITLLHLTFASQSLQCCSSHQLYFPISHNSSLALCCYNLPCHFLSNFGTHYGCDYLTAHCVGLEGSHCLLEPSGLQLVATEIYRLVIFVFFCVRHDITETYRENAIQTIRKNICMILLGNQKQNPACCTELQKPFFIFAHASFKVYIAVSYYIDQFKKTSSQLFVIRQKTKQRLG